MAPISMSDIGGCIITPADLRFLEQAQWIAGTSLDPSTKVGAVITAPYAGVIGQGRNHFPNGTRSTDELWADRTQKYARVVHAEVNAILQALGGENEVFGGTLYTTHFPCSKCMGIIINVGIKRVVTYEPPADLLERWPDMLISREMLEEADLVLAYAPVLM